MKAVSAAPDLEALGNLGGAFMHPMQWFQGLRMASIELVSLGDLQTPDLLSPDRIALAAIGIVLGILYFQKVGSRLNSNQPFLVAFQCCF